MDFTTFSTGLTKGLGILSVVLLVVQCTQVWWSLQGQFIMFSMLWIYLSTSEISVSFWLQFSGKIYWIAVLALIHSLHSNNIIFNSGLTALATYFLTKELWSAGAGLLAACFIAIVPGYISRSVAGSYDNEGIAIFALMFTYYLWVKSVKTGSVFWATLTALSYFYMASFPIYSFTLF